MKKISSKAVAALTALKSLQEDAKRKGLDKMNLDEINAEIKAHRRQKRRARKTVLDIRKSVGRTFFRLLKKSRHTNLGKIQRTETRYTRLPRCG